MQTILNFEISTEDMLERLQRACETSTRIDHTLDICKKKVSQYTDYTIPMLEFYSTFGKVRKIDANRDFADVYCDVKEALTP